MFVYLILNQDTGQHKIGVSKRPQRRLREEQTASPGTLVIEATWLSAHAFKLEKLLHANFKEHHARGEWFYLGIEAVELFLKQCAHFEQYLLLKYSAIDEW